MRSSCAGCEKWRLQGLEGDDPRLDTLPCKPIHRPHQRRARADRGDEDIEAAVKVSGDLHSHGLVARADVGRTELVSVITPGLFGEGIGARFHALDQLGRDRPVLARLDNDVGPEGLHRLPLAVGERVGEDGGEPQAQHRRNERKGCSGASAGVLDDPVPASQVAARERPAEDRRRHPILVGAGGVASLELDPDLGSIGGFERLEPDQRRVADRSQGVFGSHGPSCPLSSLGQIVIARQPLIN
jgi:hypothetical protein